MTRHPTLDTRSQAAGRFENRLSRRRRTSALPRPVSRLDAKQPAFVGSVPASDTALPLPAKPLNVGVA
jgi:hypothetical protein